VTLPPPRWGGFVSSALFPRVALRPPGGGLRFTRGYTPAPLRGEGPLARQSGRVRQPALRGPAYSKHWRASRQWHPRAEPALPAADCLLRLGLFGASRAFSTQLSAFSQRDRETGGSQIGDLRVQRPGVGFVWRKRAFSSQPSACSRRDRRISDCRFEIAETRLWARLARASCQFSVISSQ
jgi:hypothetical protein